MLLPVYNEDRFLQYSLDVPIKFVDEIIIVDGGPLGVSTDKTTNIIDEFDSKYPNKIQYLSGTFVLDDGVWDESAQRNLGLSKVSGNILMPHCGDMIYTNEGMSKMVDAIRRFPEKKIIYCLFIEFWLNQQRIRLYGGHAMEEWFPVPAISDIPFVSIDIINEYKDGPHLILKEYENNDFLFITDAFRYHYGWISGFDKQIAKHVRNITMGAWGEYGESIKIKGDKAIVTWAINHVLNYPNESCGFDYSGHIPLNLTLSYLDNYDKTIEFYENQYGQDFWKATD